MRVPFLNRAVAGLGARSLALALTASALVSCQAGNGLCTGTLVPCGQTACVNLAVDDENCGACGNVCSATETCVDAQCACRPGTSPCEGGTCAVFDSDPMNCGGCGVVCTPGQRCENGACS